MGRKANTLEGAWRFVDVRGPTECWPWIGSVKRYGVYSIKKQEFRAHRLIYALSHPGVLDPRLEGEFSRDSRIVLHKCDNPICCNPDYLQLGVPKDNTQDMIRKGRRLDNRGASHYRAQFSEEQIRDIRSRYKRGERVFELASAFQCNWQTMDDIVKNKSYRNICQ